MESTKRDPFTGVQGRRLLLGRGENGSAALHLRGAGDRRVKGCRGVSLFFFCLCCLNLGLFGPFGPLQDRKG